MISFGKNIQKRRIILGLETTDLANLLNYPDRSYIEKIEYFFKEKEYEICLVGLRDFLEKLLHSKRKKKKITENEDLIILDDFLRI